VYAKRSCPAGDPCDLLRLLHGPHRIGLRLVTILLSHWRRPRLVAKSAADAEQVVADVRQAITDLPDGAVVLAEDETHINFMEYVLAGYPTAPVVVLVLVNVLIHRSKLVQAWLRAHPRMQLLYGARYSPHFRWWRRGARRLGRVG
jgi:hypothetical protein